MGRPKKPTSLKILQGSASAKRAAKTEPRPVAKAPPCPSWLSCASHVDRSRGLSRRRHRTSCCRLRVSERLMPQDRPQGWSRLRRRSLLYERNLQRQETNYPAHNNHIMFEPATWRCTIWNMIRFRVIRRDIDAAVRRLADTPGIILCCQQFTCLKSINLRPERS